MEQVATPVLALLAVALLVGIVVRFPRQKVAEAGPDPILEYPSVAVDRYYSAITKGDYATAQALLSGPLRSSLSADALARIYAGRPVTSYSIQDLGQMDELNAYGAVSLNGQPCFVWMVREPEGWRVSWTTELGETLGLPCPV